MNAFGEALNLVFMRRSGDFSSGSMPMDSISDCIPMSPYLPANESQTAFPWVPISQPMNLRLHSHESLFPCQWISDCIPMSPYSPANESQSQTAFPWVPIPLPMNLWMHSHEFLSPCQWISGCIPMSSYLPAKFLESFGWVPPMSYHPYSKRAHRSPKNCILARFWGYPYTYHMGTPKIDCRAF